MSREALSLDISRVVSRVVSGEPIDTAENGAALAAKYPDLGMSATLISQAIDRAAGMVGMIKSAPAPVKQPRVAFAISTPEAQPKTNGNGRAVAAKPMELVTANEAETQGVVVPFMPVATIPVAGPSIEDDLAAAIDAEIGNLISGERAKPVAVFEPPSDAGTPFIQPGAFIQPAAAHDATAATLPEATVEAHSEFPIEEPQVAAEALSDFALDAESAAPRVHEQRGSIFSSFRRALFRT